MTNYTFADLGKWADKIEKNLEYVAKSSISDVLVAAQTTQIGITQGATSFVTGKIPVGLTSELVNSLTVDGATSPDAHVVAIAGMRLGDAKRFAWTAPHAMPMEVGFTTPTGGNVAGRLFVGKNAKRFPQFVKKRLAEVTR